jgi:hypothetical protein
MGLTDTGKVGEGTAKAEWEADREGPVMQSKDYTSVKGNKRVMLGF